MAIKLTTKDFKNLVNKLLKEESSITSSWPSFKDWSKTAEKEMGAMIGHETDRSVYSLPDGTKVIDHYVMPGNFLKPSYGYTLVDLQVKATPENEALVAKYGGTIDQKWGYTDEGYGLPYFKGDNSLEKAYYFVKNEKDKIVQDFEKSITEETKNVEIPEKETPVVSDFLEIDTPKGSFDFGLFKDIVNQGIDSSLEAFTKSKFNDKNDSRGQRFVFQFHRDEMPILLRRLENEYNETQDERIENWITDLKQEMEK